MLAAHKPLSAAASREDFKKHSRIALIALTLFMSFATKPAQASLGDCTQPLTQGDMPAATDCLYILRASVGTATCSPECICDADGNSSITATDALICLRVSVGQSVDLNCPCPVETTTTTSVPQATTTTTTLPGLDLIAHADFDSDLPGDSPDTALPGGPSGDSWVGSGTTSIATFTVEESAGGIETQPLVCERESGPGSFDFGLHWAPEFYSAEEFFLRFWWSGASGSPYTFVILRGPRGAIHGSLTLTRMQAFHGTAFGSQNDVLVYTWEPGTPHLFEWRVNRSSGVQSLWINGELVVDEVETEWKNIGTDATSLKFEGAFQSAMTIVVDDISAYVVSD